MYINIFAASAYLMYSPWGNSEIGLTVIDQTLVSVPQQVLWKHLEFVVAQVSWHS